MAYKIYLLTNKINKEQYVGVTRTDVKKRWQNGHGYKNQPVIYKDISQYGWNNFVHEIIDCANDYAESRRKELLYINQYNTLAPNGYNVIHGESEQRRNILCDTIIQIDPKGNIICAYNSTKELKAKYTRNQIRTIRDLLLETQDSFVPKYYDNGYWGFLSIYNEMLNNLSLKVRRTNKGTHLGKAVPVEQVGDNGEVIKVFASSRECAREIEGLSYSSLLRAIASNKKYLGFFWRRKK